MSQDANTLDKVTFAVSEGAGRVETMFTTFLKSHPEIAEALSGFGSHNDVLTVVMVGLGLSFILLLGALMLMRPRGGGYYPQPVANQEILFPKYAYDMPGDSDDKAA